LHCAAPAYGTFIDVERRYIERLAFAATILVAPAFVVAACVPSLDGLQEGCPTCSEGGDSADDDEAGSASDAGEAEAGEAGTFCADGGGSNANGLCESFDTVSFPDGRWDPSSLPRGDGKIAFDTADFVSPPGAVLISAHKDGDSAELRKSFATASANDHRLTFMFKLEQKGDTAGIANLKPAGNANPSIRYSIGSGGSKPYFEEVLPLADGGIDYVQHSVSAVPQLNEWTQMSIHIDLSASTPTFDATQVNSTGTRQIVPPTKISSAFKAGPSQIAIGLGYTQAADRAWKVRYDNVLYERK